MDSNSQMLSDHSDTNHKTFSEKATSGNRRGVTRVRILNEADLDPAAIAAWNDLEHHAISATPYLSRAFLEPAVKAQLGQYRPVYVVIERDDQWLGLGVFESVPATRAVPLPHLRSWRTNHTYLDGMLIRKNEQDIALQTFWDFMQHETHPWYAVEFRQLADEDATTKHLELTATNADVEWKKGLSKKRASLDLSSAISASPSSNNQEILGISKRRARSLRQGWNWLSRQGEVSLRIENNRSFIKQSAERFLELEAMGWKAKAGTAFDSNENNRRFFLELVDRFSRKDRLFFLELAIDEVVVASVVHFVAGDVSYAFKLGWDPKLARGCPGYQLKAQTLFQAQQMFPHLRMIDSCASPDSFIEHVWAGRREVSPRVFLTNQAAQIVCSVMGRLRWIRDRSSQLFLSGKEDRNANP